MWGAGDGRGVERIIDEDGADEVGGDGGCISGQVTEQL